MTTHKIKLASILKKLLDLGLVFQHNGKIEMTSKGQGLLSLYKENDTLFNQLYIDFEGE